MSIGKATDLVLDFLKTEKRIETYLELNQGPYFLAIQGAQGSGKSTLAKQLAATLRSPPWSLPTIVISIDDFYLTHEDQKALAAKHPGNPLVQHRGHGSTHDISLWKSTFEDLKAGKTLGIPQYNKSCFNGDGDRVDPNEWQQVNKSEIIKVVIFEGWSVGFKALSDEDLETKWKGARYMLQKTPPLYHGQLAYHELEDLQFINEALKGEEVFCRYYQDLLQISSAPLNVYKWRQQQEEALRTDKGSGMTDEQVKRFIDGYYPAYELYTEGLRSGGWRDVEDPAWRQKHVQMIVDAEREVQNFYVYS